MKMDSATGPSEGPVVWNGSPGSAEKQFRFRQSFQSARPISGSLCGEMGYGKVEGTFQVLHQRLCLGGIVVEINLLIENGEISGLFDVGGASGNQPERVIVEAASDIHVSFLGQRLILVICASVFKLGSSDIEQTLSCAVGIR